MVSLEEFEAKLRLYNPELYEKGYVDLTTYKSATADIKCRCLKCGKERLVKARLLIDEKNPVRYCRSCAVSISKSQSADEFRRQVEEVNPEIVPFIDFETFRTLREEVKGTCPICGGEWTPRAQSLLYKQAKSCRDCSSAESIKNVKASPRYNYFPVEGLHGDVYDNIPLMIGVYKKLNPDLTEGMYKTRILNGYDKETALLEPKHNTERYYMYKLAKEKPELTDHLTSVYKRNTKNKNYWIYKGTCPCCGDEWEIMADLVYSKKEGLYRCRRCGITQGKKVEGIFGEDPYISVEAMIRTYKEQYNPTLTRSLYDARMKRGFTKEEALLIPAYMSLGEHRVAEYLDNVGIEYLHDASFKKIFEYFELDVSWDEFCGSFRNKMKAIGIKWTQKRIQKLRTDFVLYRRGSDKKITGVIEFDGAQHQTIVDFFFETIRDFLMQCDQDTIKQSLWEYLNIPMLRIRDDQIDIIDELVRDLIARPEAYIKNHNPYFTEKEYWGTLNDTLKTIGALA